MFADLLHLEWILSSCFSNQKIIFETKNLLKRHSYYLQVTLMNLYTHDQHLEDAS
jgi:hypothetical protein